MLNVLLLYGDMRGSLAAYAAQQMADLLERRGLQTETLPVSLFELPCCAKCGRCSECGEEHCAHLSAVRALERRMLESRGLIVVAPVTEGTLTAQVLTVFEHLEYHRNRPAFFGRAAVAAGISEYGRALPRRAVRMMREAMEDWGYSDAKGLRLRFGDPFIVKSEAAADRLADRLLSPPKAQPSFLRVFRFNLRRAFVTFGPASPPDSLYWRAAGLLKRALPPESAESKIKSMFGSLVFRFFNAVFFKR